MFLALTIAVVIGSIAGWVVGEFIRTGFGFVGDILIGSAGASIAAFAFPMLRLAWRHELMAWAAATAIGAVILLLVACLIKRVLTVAASRT